MNKIELNLISFQIKKWDIENKRLSLKVNGVIQADEKSVLIDLSITQPTAMVEEFLKKIHDTIKEQLHITAEKKDKTTISIVDEGLVKQKLHNFLRKFLSDLSNPKRKKGTNRSGLVTNLEMYPENQNVTELPQELQFFIILNWARKYYEKEDYQHAVDPLRRLVKIKPDYGFGYKWLARSLKKLRKYDEAMRYYEMYAKVDQSVDSLLDLAKSYRKGKLFDKSEKIYQKILQEHPEEKEAKIGLAQIYYARLQDGYMALLDSLDKIDSEWLKSWLNEEFNFRIYSAKKTLMSPVQAAQLLGFKNASEVTKMAFKNEIPSHFNPSMARMSFYREEIENWAKVMNRYKLLDQEIGLYPDRVADGNEGKSNKTSELLNGEKNNVEGRTPRVEEIIRKIREARTQRENIRNTFEKSASGKKHKAAMNRKNGAGKKKVAPEDSDPDLTELMKDSDQEPETSTLPNVAQKNSKKEIKPKKRRAKNQAKSSEDKKSAELTVQKDE
jgi:tetratricopeptide (TPR) repeat protein